MGIPGAASPLLLRRAAAAAADDGVYKIENSLRFNDDDSPGLLRTLAKSGNRRTWTWSGWIKKNGQGSYQTVYGYNNPNGAHGHQLRINNDDTLEWFQFDNPNFSHRKLTNLKLRDPSAWFHVVTAFDTTQSVAADRMKLYINGERITGFSSSTDPAQNAEGTAINRTGYEQGIGRPGHWAGNYLDSCLADVYFIDGLQLPPAAFGSFDDSNCWNPKAFALPAPNNGTTWSSKVYTSDGTYSGSATETVFQSNKAGDKAFDGSTGTEAVVDEGSPPSWIYFRPTSAFKGISTLRIATSYVQSFKFNGVTVNSTPAPANSGIQWYTFDSSDIPSSLSEIAIEGNHSSGGSNARITAIEIDGVILIDGQTDPTTRNNLNDGRVWSSLGTTSGTAYNSGYDHTKVFDGDAGSQFFAATGPNSAGFTFTTSISNYDKLEMWISGPHGGLTTGFKLNGVDKTAAVITERGASQGGWIDIGKAAFLNGAALSSFEVYSTAGNTYIAIQGIKVNGHFLIDSSIDNSYRLKFSDTSSDAALGYNVFSKDLSGNNTGTAYPILKTNSTGSAVTSGYRSDSSAGTTNGAGLVLAVPGNSIASGTCDVHQQINTGSSNKTVTAQGDPATSTTKSKYYGTSIALDGSGDYLEFADSTDWDFGTGDFTVELWIYPTNTSGYVGIIGSRASSGWGLMYAPGDSYKLKFYTPTERASGNDAITVNTWQHVAVSRSGSTIKAFINGAQVFSHSDSDNANGDASLKIGTGWPSGMSELNGYIQDVRVYKGTAKYTTEFDVAPRKDFTVNNLTHAESHPNNGTVWSTYLTSTNGWWSGFENTNGFDGTPESGNYVEGGSGATITFAPPGGITYTSKVEVISKTGTTAVLNGGSGVAMSNNTYVEMATGSGTLSTLVFTRSDSTGGQLAGIKVDGTILQDSTGSSASDIDTSIDTPTSYGTTQIRGNYATLNPLSVSAGTLSSGNLHTVTSSTTPDVATIAMTTGKFYWEVSITASNYPRIGVFDIGSAAPSNLGGTAAGWCFLNSASRTYVGGTATNYGSLTFAAGTVIGMAYDADAGKLWIAENNTWQASGNPATGANPGISSITGSAIVPAVASGGSGSEYQINFGQRAFKYTAPSGFTALCNTNLGDLFGANDNSAEDKNDPSKYFNVKLWSGNSINPSDIVTSDFSPDLLWIKDRNQAWSIGHRWYDRARGAGVNKHLDSSAAAAQGSGNDETYGYVSAFTSTGFTTHGGSTGDADYVNKTNVTYVAYTWDAGSSAATAATEGSLTASSQWVNKTSGFSISLVSYSSGNQTVGHGLEKEPGFIITKNADTTDAWITYHQGAGKNRYFMFNTSGGQWTDSPNAFTGVDDEVFNLKSGIINNGTHICYAWAPIEGYSAFGLYTGNNSNSDGPFIHLGFQPRFLMIKNRTGTAAWRIYDTERDLNNPMDSKIFANSSEVEASSSTYHLDVLSNGFKPRTNQVGINQAVDYVYCAWAEHPYKTARAR